MIGTKIIQTRKDTIMFRTMTLATALMLACGMAYADTFVLVHGAFQTGASWQGVAEGLRAAGHGVEVVTLPGRDNDGRALGEVTMADHVAAVQAALDRAEDPTYLVGHSFGGMVISATAEASANEVAGLIYVAAYLPASGQSMQDMAMMDHHNAFREDSFQVAADYSHATINPRDRAEIFANDADAALAASVADALVNEPLQPVATPLTLTDENVGSIRKSYVLTLRDNAVSTPFQMTMVGRGLVDEVVPLDSGHSPQATAVDALVQALLAAATPELE
jgi:pimeloyl-ACP methyl ester carboxylesterase